MRYYLDLFTPRTWQNFRRHGSTVSGFREAQRRSAERIQPGDRFLCYLVGLSRWCGILDVKSSMYEDATPLFDDPDPFVLRFEVSAAVELEFQHSVPIFESELWDALSSTRDLKGRVPGWAQSANLRASLRELERADGELIERILQEQSKARRLYSLSTKDERRIRGKNKVRTADRDVVVEVPDDEIDEANEIKPVSDVRESHTIQAMLCAIGAEMGFRLWVPRADRQNVQTLTPLIFHDEFLEELPLNYDDSTLRTVEQIDVIWLKNRSMARAFEVEHTTAIYSGLLRMADLLALQPNMNIRLHIVAPEDRRDKVLRELSRPVFSLLDRGPLYESCTYLSYDAVRELSREKHLAYMTDDIIEQFEETVEED